MPVFNEIAGSGPWEGFKDVTKVNGNFAEEEMREAVWSDVRGGEA